MSPFSLASRYEISPLWQNTTFFARGDRANPTFCFMHMHTPTTET